MRAHPRKQARGRLTDPFDFRRRAYALRDIAFLERASRMSRQRDRCAFARSLLDVPTPWTRMRRVYALPGLVKRYGAERVKETCRIALEVDLLDVTRLRRTLALATSEPPKPPPGRVIAIARFLRPAKEYACTARSRWYRPMAEVSDDDRGDHR